MPTGEIIDLDKVETFGPWIEGKKRFTLYCDSGHTIDVYNKDCWQDMVDRQRKASLYHNEYWETLIVDLFAKACPDGTYTGPQSAVQKIEKVLDGK